MSVSWAQVGRDDVLRAIQEYDRLGADEFFAAAVSARPQDIARLDVSAVQLLRGPSCLLGDQSFQLSERS